MLPGITQPTHAPHIVRNATVATASRASGERRKPFTIRASLVVMELLLGVQYKGRQEPADFPYTSNNTLFIEFVNGQYSCQFFVI
jgi:hypothetical protein